VGTKQLTPPTTNPPPTRPEARIPASIDSTGAADVSAAVQSWLSSLAAGTRAIFVPTGVAAPKYQMSKGACVTKDGIELDGGDVAEIRAKPGVFNVGGNGGVNYTSQIILGMNTTGFTPARVKDIVVHGFRLTGNGSPSTAPFEGEWQCSVFVGPVDGFEVYDLVTDKARGDFFAVAGYGASAGYVHDIVNTRCERNGITLDNIKGIRFSRIKGGITAYYCMDFEQGARDGRFVDDVVVEDTEFVGWASKTNDNGGGFLAAMNGNAACAPRNIKLQRIKLTGSDHATIQIYIGQLQTTNRLNGLLLEDITSVQTLPAAYVDNQAPFAFQIRNTDGLIIRGCKQPGAAGPGRWFQSGYPQNCGPIQASGNTPALNLP
jgi:hypothetical protein